MTRSRYSQRRRWSFLRTLVDFFLVFATGGLWLIWIIIRYLRNNS